jgi:hypothetical protein
LVASGLEVALSLVVAGDTSGGAKFEIVPVTVDLSGELANSAIQKITVVRQNPEPKKWRHRLRRLRIRNLTKLIRHSSGSVRNSPRRRGVFFFYTMEQELGETTSCDRSKERTMLAMRRVTGSLGCLFLYSVLFCLASSAQKPQLVVQTGQQNITCVAFSPDDG